MENEVNILKNRADCINKVNKYLYETAKDIQKELENGFKTNNDYTLHKKAKDKVKEIENKRKHFRAVLYANEYSIYLWADDTYIVKRYEKEHVGVNYYKKTVYIWDVTNNKPYEIEKPKKITEKQLKNAEIKLEKLKDDVREKNESIQKLERLLN